MNIRKNIVDILNDPQRSRENKQNKFNDTDLALLIWLLEVSIASLLVNDSTSS